MAWRHAACAAALLVMEHTGFARAQPPCTVKKGPDDIDQGRYKSAAKEFSCVIDTQPAEVEGYRGRAEAELLLGLYLGCACWTPVPGDHPERRRRSCAFPKMQTTCASSP